MAYDPQTWVDHQTSATAARMNHMEEGIAQAHDAAKLPDTGWIQADLRPPGLVQERMYYRRIGDVVYISGRLRADGFHLPLDEATAPGGGRLWEPPVGFQGTSQRPTVLGSARPGDDVMVYVSRQRLYIVGAGDWHPGGSYPTNDPFPAP